MVHLEDVLTARDRIAGHVRRTPMLPAGPGGTPAIKAEHLQLTGVFKVRGAMNLLLAAKAGGDLDGDRGLVVASGGNAGLANAYAAASLGVPADVVVPVSAPDVKVRRLEAYGATVHRVGQEYAEAASAAAELAVDRGALLSHAYDLPEIVAGAGTIGLEILEDNPSTQTVLVAVGGGGLAAGVAAALKGQCRVVAVEPTGSRCLAAALAAGEPVDVAVDSVAADSLGARRVGDIAFAVATRTGMVSVVVDDDAIVAARQALWDDFRIVAEYGAATAYAALTSGAYRPGKDEEVCVLVSGGNTDPATVA
jgi:threonine dehydratase